jgi:hypothetical protein
VAFSKQFSKSTTSSFLDWIHSYIGVPVKVLTCQDKEFLEESQVQFKKKMIFYCTTSKIHLKTNGLMESMVLSRRDFGNTT